MNDKVVTDPKDKQTMAPQNVKNVALTKPNEVGGFNFSSHVRITDPNTGQILVQKRGDL